MRKKKGIRKFVKIETNDKKKIEENIINLTNTGFGTKNETKIFTFTLK